MRVAAITSWGGACGIANYCEMLKDALAVVAPDIVLEPFPEALDPIWLLDKLAVASVAPGLLPHVVWLNHHMGLCSRWTPAHVKHIQANYGIKVVMTAHDTFGERKPSDLFTAFHDQVDAFIVHEPCLGLEKQILIRQGVPAPASVPVHLTMDDGRPAQRWFRPMLGVCGFNFPWKGFDRLAEVTAEAGWAYLVLSNDATDADGARWKAANPYTLWRRGFMPTNEMVAYLSACDATCFAYECANSGTSGAIRLGLAARKPVIAWGACRQFRDLYQTADRRGIHWCSGFPALSLALAAVPIQCVDPGITYIAHRDSWVNHGKRYAEIFRSCCP